MNNYDYLFLDRDGVINIERPKDYVKSIEEFVFEEGVLDAIGIFNHIFKKIFIVTNQRGIGRGIYSESVLFSVHNYMLNEINKKGGRIDRIYFCADIEDSSPNRKPNIGMGIQAKNDFSDIEFEKSMMVGNSKSDIEFGKRLGMYTVLVGNKYPESDTIYEYVDKYYENLLTFALDLIKKNKDDKPHI